MARRRLASLVVLAAASLLSSPRAEAAFCLPQRVSGGGTTPEFPPGPPPSSWGVTGGLLGGDITAECGGSVFVTGSAVFSYINRDDPFNPVLASGSVNLKDEGRLDVADTLAIGSKGTMRVESGGRVSSGTGLIGVATGEPAVNEIGNVAEVTIDGSDSRWDIAGTLTLVAEPGVPTGGTKATLSLTNGATLIVAQSLRATDSEIRVLGGSFVDVGGASGYATSIGGASTVTIGSGGAIAGDGSFETYGTAEFDVSDAALGFGLGARISDDSRITIRDGSTMDTGQLGTASDRVVIGRNAGGAPSSVASVLVTGAGSRWTHVYDAVVGGSGGAGLLQVVDGALFEDRDGRVGGIDAFGGTALSHSAALVRGPGSEWRNHRDFLVATLDAVDIQQGGVVSNEAGAWFNGQVNIDGAGSQWNNELDLTLYAPLSPDNAISITNGGALHDVVGYQVSGAVTVDGLQSAWFNLGDLVTGGTRDAFGRVLIGSTALTVRNGGSVTDNFGRIAQAGDSAITITDGGTWVNRLDVALGAGGTAAVLVSDRGVVSTNGAGYIGYIDLLGASTTGGGSAALRVTGRDSLWQNGGDLWVGFDTGKGLLRVEDGGEVRSQAGHVGYALGVFDRANLGVYVDGAGSAWSITRGIDVGVGNPNQTTIGDVRVRDGGTLASAGGRIGAGSPTSFGDGRVTVTGANSTWVNAGTLSVGAGGDFGRGELHVESGGLVTDGVGSRALPAQIGVGAGAENFPIVSGSVFVDGALSEWSYNGNLEIGRNAARGRLDVTNGGLVSTGGSVVAGRDRALGLVPTRADMTVKDADSTWIVGGDFHLGASDVDALLTVNDGGTVHIAGDLTIGDRGLLNLGVGGRLTARTIDLAGSGSLTWLGALSATSILDPLVNNGGIFSPGQSPANAALPGYSQGAGGTLEMEIGGLASGAQYDHLDVEGALSLDGVLRILLIDGFQPIGGELFDLLDWQSEAGLFASFELPNLRPGLSWNTDELYTDGVVRIDAVPEPSTLILLALGVAGLAIASRRGVPQSL